MFSMRIKTPGSNCMFTWKFDINWSLLSLALAISIILNVTMSFTIDVCNCGTVNENLEWTLGSLGIGVRT